MPIFKYGDVVRISDDIVRVHSLQPGHGEWNDDIALVREFSIFRFYRWMLVYVPPSFL